MRAVLPMNPVAADARRLTLIPKNNIRTSLRRLLRFRGSKRELLRGILCRFFLLLPPDRDFQSHPIEAAADRNVQCHQDLRQPCPRLNLEIFPHCPFKTPLSPSLSPLVPRGERGKNLGDCATQGGARSSLLLGYYQPSLRDEDVEILVALDLLFAQFFSAVILVENLRVMPEIVKQLASEPVNSKRL